MLDVREKLGNLEIIYGGVDIQKARKSLRVVVLKVTNDGPDDILKTHYDDTSPFGFKISKGDLLRAEVIGASNPYLRQALSVGLLPNDTAIFTPVILEAGEWFTIKSLVIHPEDVRPSVQPIGKIAGVKEIRVIEPAEAGIEASFVAQVIYGSAWVQIVRLFFYTVGLIVVALIIVVPTIAVSESLTKRRRRGHVAQFKVLTKLKLIDRDEYIFDQYMESDIYYLQRLQRIVSDEEKLNQQIAYEEEQRRRMQKEVAEDKSTMELDLKEEIYIRSRGLEHAPLSGWGRIPFKGMKRAGFITQVDGRWRIDVHLKDTLDEFVRYLEIKRAT